MERQTYEKGRLICQKDEKAESLFLIQDGIVEVALKYDRRREDQNFVIERLARGAIINHRSFMVRDDADTDFVCHRLSVTHTDGLSQIQTVCHRNRLSVTASSLEDLVSQRQTHLLICSCHIIS